MLHLNVVRADRACSTHAHHEMPTASQPEHDAHGSHTAPMHGTQATDADQSCDTPSQSDCCQALVSCSVVLGLNASARALTATPQNDGAVASALQRAPLSRIAAPEPPPPRA
jgi:hypothetical protein